MSEITPMMQQYREIHSSCPGAILFFRLGDFYEMFGQDALEASKILDIALTSRNKNDPNPLPMCGVPYHAAENYIAKLIKAGKRVAICEQISDPALPGIVKRKIVRLITPGTTYNEQILGAKANRFILALFPQKDYFGLAFADLSTGEFKATEISGIEDLKTELIKIKPAEIVLHEDHYSDPAVRALLATLTDAAVSSVVFYDEPRVMLSRHFKVTTLDVFGLSGRPFAVHAAGLLLKYLLETQKEELRHINRIVSYTGKDIVPLDEATIRNLEIFATIRDKDEKNTLLSILDETVTAMGGRMLRSWVSEPLTRRDEIEERLNAVGEIVENAELRGDLTELLKKFNDLERLLGRLSGGAGNARDLLALGESLALIPQLKTLLSGAKSRLLAGLQKALLPLEELADEIGRGIADSPPLKLTEGGIIKTGYSSDLDALLSLMKDGKNALRDMEKAEIERSGINSLKVGFNRVFGYFIEVSKVNLPRVPDHYIRKQTLANAERFVTEELKEYEEKVLTAEERSKTLEYELFLCLRDKAISFVREIKDNAMAIAKIDTVVALAAAAVRRRYTRPTLTSDNILEIRGGRHPVVESMTAEEAFIPNDALFIHDQVEIKLITGPNMSGKSTYLRQVALIVLMAQIGSFVPAREARLRIFDRIFTRVGASDNLVRGESTFMVEMQESAYILNHATEKSLIILDEVGRGTSTYDGLSLAWAIFEHLHNKTRAFSLFATHYHELIELAEKLPRAKNYSVDIAETPTGVLFLHQIREGGIDKSYGIEVARLAGLPHDLVTRAKELLHSLENNQKVPTPAQKEENQLDIFAGSKASLAPLHERFTHPALERLKQLDPNTLTPLEALNALSELKKID
ncbi:MAG: DNA mismatch repair protein MutS [Candidatus Gracilibacteria bacterium]|jgi:DNA mismatch repair protein MutS